MKGIYLNVFVFLLQENIEYGDVADEIGTPAPLIALVDKASSNCVIRTSQVDLRESDRRGLLWLLDEEAIFPGASDQSFLERLYAHYGDRGITVLSLCILYLSFSAYKHPFALIMKLGNLFNIS